MIYVIAGNYSQARDFARDKGVHHSSMVFIDCVEKMRGLARGTTEIHVYGTPRDLECFHDLMREAP